MWVPYRALTEMQLLKLYPHKESKIRNLLSYLQKQGRIVQRGEYYRIPADTASITYFVQDERKNGGSYHCPLPDYVTPPIGRY